MADDSAVEQLLLKFGLDLEPVKKAGGDIKLMLEQLNAMSAKTTKETKEQLTAYAAALKEIDIATKAILKTTAAQLQEEKAKQEKVKTEAQELKKQGLEYVAQTKQIRQQTEELLKKKTVSVLETAELEKQRKARQIETAEISKQIAALRLKKAEDAAIAQQQQAHSGFLGKLWKGVVGASLGQGLAGGVAAGVLTGGGMLMAGQGLISMIERLIQKLKEAGEKASDLTKMEVVFKRAAAAAGVDGVEMLNKLKEATEGEVSSFRLMSMSVAMFRAHLKLSKDEITDFIGKATQVAEALGKAQPEQTVRMIEMAMARGRPEMLGRYFGLTRAQMTSPNLAPGMTPRQRELERWNWIIEQIKKRYEEIGEMPQTIENAHTRMRIAVESWFTAFGKGLTMSAGMQTLLIQISDSAKGIRNAGSAAEEFGKSLGNAIQYVVPLLHGIGTVFGNILETLGKIITIGETGALNKALSPDETTLVWLQRLGKFFLGLETILNAVIAIGQLFVATIKSAVKAGLELTALFNVANIVHPERIRDAFKNAWKALETGGAEMVKSTQDFLKDTRESWQKFADDMMMMRIVRPINIAPRKDLGGGGDEEEQDTIAHKNKLLQMELAHQQKMTELEIERAKTRLALLEENLDDEKRINQEAYDSGEKSLEDYIARQVELIREGHQARVEEAKEEAALQLAQFERRRVVLNQQLALRAVQPADYKIQVKELEDDRLKYLENAHQREISENRKYLNDLDATQKKSMEDRRNARLKAISEELHDEQQRISLLQQLNEKRFTGGRISPDQYFQTRLQLIEAEAVAEMDAAKRTFDQNRNNLGARATMERAMRDSVAKAERELTLIVEDEADKRAAAVERQYGPATQALERQIEYQLKRPGGRFEETVESLVGRLNEALETSRQKQFELLQNLEEGGLKYSTTWWNIANQIEKGWDSQVKFNEELLRMRDHLTQISGVMQDVVSASQGIFTSRFAQNLLSEIGIGVQSLEKAAERARAMFPGRFGVQEDPAITELKRNMGDVYQAAEKSASSVVEPFDNLRLAALSLTTGLLQLQGILMQITGRQTMTVTQGPALRGEWGVPPELRAGQPELAPWVYGSMTRTPGAVPGQEGRGGQLFADVRQAASSNVVTPFGLIQGAARKVENAFATLVRTVDTLKNKITGEGEEKKDEQEDKQDTDKKTKTGTQQAHQELALFVTRIRAGVAAIGDFVSALTHAQSGIAGALGGGLSGAGMMASFGFGPIGQIIGGIAGGVMGGIMGSKQHKIRENIDAMNVAYKDVMNEFARNSNNLQYTIERLEGLLAEVRTMQANSKKGSSQYQQLIDQYIQQIIDLRNQQVELMRSLDQELAVLGAPIQMQEYMKTLEGIVKQYQQFRGAAQSAQELQNATQFLVQSLEDYEWNLENRLAEDEEAAINDALKLNDLLWQRKDLINTINTQIANVMAQGVLVRQPTRAMTAGQQIALMQYQYTRQLEQLNEQIAAAQYRVDREGEIFNLATTRIGLENQLLEAQNRQTNLDIQRIQALTTFLQALQSGDLSQLQFSLPILQALINAIPQAKTLGSGTTPAPAAPAPSPYPQYPGYPGEGYPGMNTSPSRNIEAYSDVDAMIAGAYQDRATLGYAAFRGQNL